MVDARSELWQLAYVSTAVRTMTGSDLESIRLTAADRNRARDVTGMLAYAGGSFFQILEGSESSVTELYERIAADRRHHRLVLLMLEPTARRAFPDWSMGPVGGSLELFAESGDVDTFFDNLRPVFRLDEPRLERMLRQFHAGLTPSKPE